MKHSHHKLHGVMSVLMVLAMFFTAMPSGALAADGEPVDTAPAVTEPVQEPAVEPVTEPVPEPTTQPATEPVTEPETEPTIGSGESEYPPCTGF